MQSKNGTPDSLLVCGFLWSGSSAVVDLLRSAESIGVLPGEFDEFRRPGMVADHLEGLISEVYPSRLVPELNLLSRIRALIPFDRRLRYKSKTKLSKLREALLLDVAQKIDNESSSSYEKMKCARDWLSSLKQVCASDKSYLLIDQPILWGQHLSVWPEFYAPFKMIVVARNPLDQMAEVIRQKHLFLHFRSPEADIWGGAGVAPLIIVFIHFLSESSIIKESARFADLKGCYS